MLRTFKDVSRFVVGTIGQPGERSFWIQISSGNEVISLAVEKGQVAALAERLKAMGKEISLAHPLIPKAAAERDSLPLDTPVMGDFRVGSIAIFFDIDTTRIQIDFRELSNSEVDEDDDIFTIESPAMSDLQVVRVFISIAQAKGFAERADLVVSAGRAPCPFCGLPINPDGHLCARANGYRR
jgi:uncharacterized repeat protein (TIGR03847 family)